MNSEFMKRHNFDEAETNVLRYHFPKIEFEFIPQAWIYKIDELLKCIKKSKIQKIYQLFGYFILVGDIDPSEEPLIRNTERSLYFIDEDIREEVKKAYFKA
jgi:hypothetical protein